jgi:uncharacterized protein YcbK (DUF882 family)
LILRDCADCFKKWAPAAAGKRVATGVALMGLLVSGQSLARTTRGRAIVHRVTAAPLVMRTLLEPGTLPSADQDYTLSGQEYRLNLHHLHTGESVSVVYRVGNTYIPAAMEQLNHFLRDHRTDEASEYAPTEFDLLYNLMGRLGKPKGEIEIVCGYRTPQSNEYLRSLGPDTGVAEHSQHVLAKAIDIRVPGVGTRQVRDAALSLDAGGVGYYPRSQFVHVDVGPVREWSFAGGGGGRAKRKRRVRA